MRKSEFEPNGIAPGAGDSSTPSNAPFVSLTAGDALIEAIADAVTRRLEQIQTTRKRLLTLEHAAEYLGMSEDTAERLISSGRLMPVRGLDRPIRFDVRDLDKLIEDARSKRP